MKAQSPRHQTWPKMPAFGVAETIMGPHTSDSAALFRLWLVSHDDRLIGSRFWRVAVLHELLVPPGDDLTFEAVGELLR